MGTYNMATVQWSAAGYTYSILIAHNHLRNRAINIATKATNAIAGKNSFSSSIFVAPKWTFDKGPSTPLNLYLADLRRSLQLVYHNKLKEKR